MNHQHFLHLLHLIEKLKNNTRHSWTSSGRHESVAEHSFRLCMMAYFLQDEFPQINMDKVMKMCLFHDMGEAFTRDIPAFDKNEEDEKTEEAAVDQWLGALPPSYQGDLAPLFEEMNCLQSPEAQFYKALDKLEALIQHGEASIDTWLPIEYELNFTYGLEECAPFPYLADLRALLNEEFTQKIKEKGAANSL